MNEWLTAQEMTGLPGLPTTDRRIREMAARENWRSRQRVGSKAKEYALSCLPSETQAAFVTDALKKAPAIVVPVKATLPATRVNNPLELANWQRDCALARLAFVRETERLAVAIGKSRAVDELVTRAAAADLPGHLQRLVKVANAKSGERAAFSRRTLISWCSLTATAEAQSKSAVAVLAPKARDYATPTWAGALIKAFSQPQKPALTNVLIELSKILPAEHMPSFDQARRFLKSRMGNVDVLRGRVGARELKNFKPFVRRDFSMLLPTDIYTADGHTFDAEIAHPRHGQAFRPEITSIMDVATRKIVGWSCDLAESRWAVLDAIRMAATMHGIHAIFYVDNGSGYKNDLQTAEGVGLSERLGFTLKHALPYNSQAKGIIERSHRTVWVRAAKKLPTYMGADMDAEARKKVFKITRADIKTTGGSRLLMPWSDFVQFVQQEADDYNNLPHSSLPEIRDSITGKRRHMTPSEVWQAAVNKGFEAVLPTTNEAQDLFRPYIIVNVRRCEIVLFKNRYFSRELEQYHGEDVQAGYDIHDPSGIFIRDLDGRFICRAGLDANKQPYMPQSVIEQAQERREQGRLRRAQNKIDEIMLERNPRVLLEHMESVQVPGLDLSRTHLDRQLAALNSPVMDAPMDVAFNALPLSFPEPTETYNPALEGQRNYLRWQRIDEMKRNGESLSVEDAAFWEYQQSVPSFQRWHSFYAFTDEGYARNETSLL